MRPILVMGVAGSGKTTLAQALAELLGRAFIEGDDLHTDQARAKMAAGAALTDADRAPWLDRIAQHLEAGDGPVLACSALRRAYRDRLRQVGRLQLVYCAITPEEAAKRLASRQGHFFPATLLPAQFAVLEEPGSEEEAYVVHSHWPVEDAARRAAAHFGLVSA